MGWSAPSEPIDPTAGQYGQQGQPYPGQYGQADPYAGQHGAPAGWSGGQGQQSGFLPNDDKSFFASLFDFSFSSFVTPKIVKAVYIVVTAVIGLGIVATLITAFVSRQGATIVLALILAPLVGLIYLALARMTLEMYYAIIRLSEDVHKRLPPQ